MGKHVSSAQPTKTQREIEHHARTCTKKWCSARRERTTYPKHRAESPSLADAIFSMDKES